MLKCNKKLGKIIGSMFNKYLLNAYCLLDSALGTNI